MSQFYRVSTFDAEIADFLKTYYYNAQKSGVVVEGELQSPSPQQISYFRETIGLNFSFELTFISLSLKKWLPRMNAAPREKMANALYDALANLRDQGKTESILQNAYIKIMCWLYYKFERISNHIGDSISPKIITETSPGMYQIALFAVLHKAGCDVVWLMYAGEEEYLKHDPKSKLSIPITDSFIGPFPEHYCLEFLRQEVQEEQQKQLLCGPSTIWSVGTNTWNDRLSWIDALKTLPIKRESAGHELPTCAYIICGVEDKERYVSDLYQIYTTIKSEGRHVAVLNMAPEVSVDDINSIRRQRYQTKEQLISSLVGNITSSNRDLQALMRRAFVDTLTSPKMKATSIEKLTGIAVYLICYMKQYQSLLFEGWNHLQIPCLFRMGECKDQKEVLFYEMLCELPVDIIVLSPNSSDVKWPVQGMNVITYDNVLPITRFPQNAADIQSGTVAYHAERDLDTLLYQDTGMYRDQQYSRAEALILRTTYEEVPILWDQELKFRPNFIVEENKVALPTIFAKVSGVKDGDIAAYWSFIKSLITPDVMLIDHVPYTRREDENPIKQYATQFWRNSRLQRTAIKESAAYQYNFLRESVQDHILDNLEYFINSKAIKGTFQNGTEYIILSTVLNLKKEILQLLNRFDFTKKNPKVIYIATSEQGFSLEDTITMVFLNRLGFDVLVFVPTGYQCFEQYLNSPVCVEHQMGEYMYNLTPPKMSDVPLAGTQKNWREKLRNFITERI